ncbi:hypothetical protein ACF052_33220 [Streptomyces pilosus]|uniref:hypothetical protein n=1 Tax=Streptomyces pilosus TaxID=28893 RepID=UPI0036FEE777
MDAAIVGAVAAVLGAAVGAGGAVAAAALTGHKQDRGQHRQWRRDVRRTAYVSFLDAAREVDTQIGELHAAMITADELPTAGDPATNVALRDLGERIFAVKNALEGCGKAQLAVELEGPPPVATLALRASYSLHLWAAREFDRWHSPAMDQVLRIVGRDRATLRFDDGSFPDEFHDQARHVHSLIDELTVLSRHVLDDPSGKFDRE